MTIITNNQLRPVIYGYELTQKEASRFDYLAEDELPCATFFRYRGEVYDLNEFVRVVPGEDSDGSLKRWDGVSTDTFFSGTLVRLVGSEALVVGTYYC
jgi:hypothetical protein